MDRHDDITDLNLDSESFDFIYCSNVLEHIIDDQKAMSELYRVLSPQGMALIQVPIRGEQTYEDYSITDPNERHVHFGQFDHVRYYGSDIKIRLQKAGFRVQPFVMLDELSLSQDEIDSMNLNKRELVHLCFKD